MKKLSQTNKVKLFDNGKENCLKSHFLFRIKERLGFMKFRLTSDDYDHIVASIRNERPCKICEIKYLYNQSIRLMIFELTFPDIVPFNIVYDRSRHAIVTILFQQDGIELTSYYDIFMNKISIKHHLGFNRHWKIIDSKLEIPNETVVLKDDIYEVTSEGSLFEKRFKFDGKSLYEIM